MSNSITFAHISDQENDFPKIRVWGTLGWISASWAFPMIWLQTDLNFQLMPPFFVGTEVPQVTSRLSDALKFSGIISVCYGAFCFLLPSTPPKKDAVDQMAFKKAFGLFRFSSFTVLVISSLAISIIHQIYFLQTGPFLSSLGIPDSQIGPAMTIGQFAEILTMAFLGYFLKNIGFKKLLLLVFLPIACDMLFLVLNSFPVWIIVISQAFHGFCYAFFFAAAYIYVDKLADEDVRHSAQTVFGIIILGGGPVIGGWLSGFLQSVNTVNGIFNFSSFWYTLSLIGFVTTVLFFMFF